MINKEEHLHPCKTYIRAINNDYVNIISQLINISYAIDSCTISTKLRMVSCCLLLLVGVVLNFHWVWAHKPFASDDKHAISMMIWFKCCIPHVYNSLCSAASICCNTYARHSLMTSADYADAPSAEGFIRLGDVREKRTQGFRQYRHSITLRTRFDDFHNF